GLDPFHLTLLVIETFSIAVVARLVSLPVTVAAGILLLGVGHAMLLQFHPRVLPLVHAHLPTVLIQAIDQLRPNLSVVILFVALLLLRKLDELGEGGGRSFLIGRAVGVRSAVNRRLAAGTSVAVGVVAIVLPFLLTNISIAYGQRMLAYAIIFTSIVCVT